MQAAFKGPEISIHALLAESDGPRPCGPARIKISIHALLAESDPRPQNRKKWHNNFYPRSPCGERPSSPAELRRWCEISIHALLAESDHILKPFKVGVLVFLSTLSLRRATRRCARSRQCAAISIHALLAESDGVSTMDNGVTQISIHALLAESDVHHKQHITPHNVFLSTLSLRRATSALQSLAGPGRYFYPRSPCGERPPRMISSIRSISISIHALLAESDALLCNNPGSCLISIHALLAESDS